MTEIKYWMWLSLALNSNSRKITAVIENFDGPQEVYNCSSAEIFKKISEISAKDVKSLLDKSMKNVDDVWKTCKNKGIRILTFSSSLYPEELANIYDPPYVLYVRCRERINLNDYLKIAMVGNRELTDFGGELTKQLAYDFAKEGAIVVSGMAEGIDGKAHEGALEAGGTTVAVLGSGVDVCYPIFHQELMDKIIERGMVISEFPPGTPPLPMNFPIRNRIISGLSEATVVCEAPKKSGSLITADCALEQGREVFAVPGNINLKHYEGTNNLLKQGARVITDAEDVLKDFSGQYEKFECKTCDEKKQENKTPKENAAYIKTRENDEEFVKTIESATDYFADFEDEKTDFTKNLTPSETLIMENLKIKPIHIDNLREKCGLAPNILNSNLTILEMRGLVKSHPGKNFSLNL